LQLNIAYPETGLQKCLDIDDDRILRNFYDKRIAQEVEGDVLGAEFEGYRFRISGGNDKQGFPMLQGILTDERVRLLLVKGSKCYRQRRTGERKRKSVRGCIVNQDLSVLNLVVIKRGAADIPGLSDGTKDIRLGPKRANKIRKLWGFDKTDDVRQGVVRRKITTKGGKEYSKAPKIQRLVTPVRLQRKRHMLALKKSRVVKNKTETAAYVALLAQRKREAKDARDALLAKRRSSHASSNN
jgi:small subunit ribosomal protein S6e